MRLSRINARVILWIVLALSLISSVVLFAAFTPSRVERVLFFPGAVDKQLEGEPRLIPRQENLEADVEVFLEELTYRPGRIDRSRIVPQNVRATSVMVRDRTLYADLSPSMLGEDDAINLSVEESVAALEYNLAWNFRELDRIVLTIGGELLRQEQPDAQGL